MEQPFQFRAVALYVSCPVLFQRLSIQRLSTADFLSSSKIYRFDGAKKSLEVNVLTQHTGNSGCFH
jgi:hypothetical protein